MIITSSSSSSLSNSVSLLPVSKCQLTGVIVAVERRGSNRTIQFVLDDGTGLMDCLLWEEHGLYELPSLLLSYQYGGGGSGMMMFENESANLAVGTVVTVHGRIE